MIAKVNLSHQRFGHLMVLHESPERRNGHVYWLCQCDCGTTKEISGASLRKGISRSCGCGVAKSNVRRSMHGMTNSSEHKTWRLIISRCSNPNNPGFKNYGGRGITICDRWRNSFECFFKDMGRKPTQNHSIDRIDNNKGYNPNNCRWAIRLVQNRNTRLAKNWRLYGYTFESSSDAAKHFGVSSATITRWCNDPRHHDCKSTLKYGS